MPIARETDEICFGAPASRDDGPSVAEAKFTAMVAAGETAFEPLLCLRVLAAAMAGENEREALGEDTQTRDEAKQRQGGDNKVNFFSMRKDLGILLRDAGLDFFKKAGERDLFFRS